MATLDVLIRARDQATSTIRGVGASVRTVGTQVQATNAKATAAASSISGWAKKLGGIFGVVVGGHALKSAWEAFDQLQKATRTLQVGLDKIHAPDELDEITDWAETFSEKAGILESDLVTMAARLSVMGQGFFKAVGPDAAHWLEVMTEGLQDMAAATGKSVSMLMRSLGPSILNTPEKAIPLLQKLGALTDAQAASIKQLTDAGDDQAATMAILNQLTETYGGTAARTADASDHLSVALDKVKRTVGQLVDSALERMLPILDVLADNAGTLLTAFLGYKALTFLPTLLLYIASAMEAVGLAASANRILAFGDALKAFGAGPLAAVVAGAAAFKIALDEVHDALGAELEEAVDQGGQAIDELRDKLRRAQYWLDSLDASGLFSVLVPGFGALKDEVHSAGEAADKAAVDWDRHQAKLATNARAVNEVRRSSQLLRGATLAEAEAAAEAEQHQYSLARAHDAATKAARNQWAAELTLAGGFLSVEGAILSAQQATADYKAARREANELEAKGKKNTNEYRDALMRQKQAALQATQAQASLVQSVRDYVDENGKSRATTKQAIAMVRDFGQKAGLTKGDIQSLVAEVRTYIGDLARVPEAVRTHVQADTATANYVVSQFVQKWNNTHVSVTMDIYTALHGRLPGQARGGPVAAGSPYIVGEEGPELFVSDRPGRIIPNHSMMTWLQQGEGGGETGTSRPAGQLLVLEGRVDAEGGLRIVAREEIDKWARRKGL